MTQLLDLSAAIATGSDAHSRSLSPTRQEIRAMPQLVQGSFLLMSACLFFMHFHYEFFCCCASFSTCHCLLIF
jgi:hypothetical protein